MKNGLKNNSVTTALLLLSLILFRGINGFAAETTLSDPDHISTGYEFRGVSDVRLGETFGYGNFSFGAMADIRNEKQFNSEIIPNHNWRGFLFLYFTTPLNSILTNKEKITLTCGIEHESAHPTGGLNDAAGGAYDRIYDGTYRNINMNSLMTRLSGSYSYFTFTGDAQFYYGRNTPELPVNKLTWSEGVSGSVEFRYPVKGDCFFFISLFDRYIFQGGEKTSGNIYFDTDSGTIARYTEYPVINNINTVSIKTGLLFGEIIPFRNISVYCGFLYGSIYGFIDSREKRAVYSIGIEVLH